MGKCEETLELCLDYSKLQKVAEKAGAVIPVAVQDDDTKEVILIAYMNELALKETAKKKELVLWSTSRNELWHKGGTSGEFYIVREVCVNCEQNSLLVKVVPKSPNGGMCHTKNKAGKPRKGCYYRSLDLDTMALKFKEE